MSTLGGSSGDSSSDGETDWTSPWLRSLRSSPRRLANRFSSAHHRLFAAPHGYPGAMTQPSGGEGASSL